MYLYQQKIIKNYLKDQFIGMNVKPKVRIKEQQMSTDIFLDKILLELIDLFFLLYSNQDVNSKRFKTRRYYLPK